MNYAGGGAPAEDHKSAAKPETDALESMPDDDVARLLAEELGLGETTRKD